VVRSSVVVHTRDGQAGRCVALPEHRRNRDLQTKRRGRSFPCLPTPGGTAPFATPATTFRTTLIITSIIATEPRLQALVQLQSKQLVSQVRLRCLWAVRPVRQSVPSVIPATASNAVCISDIAYAFTWLAARC